MNIEKDEDEFKNDHEEIGMELPQPQNNAPSNYQITAEQIIREAQAHKNDEIFIPVQKISDEDELYEYQLKKRREFEDQIRRQKYNISQWLKYALWEENQQNFKRARSIYERAIEIDYKNPKIYNQYIEFEIKNKFINHARNVFERVCKILPNNEQFWLKWCYLEEKIGNYVGCREIYKAWMTWNPKEYAWNSFCKFEERMGNKENSRDVMYNYMENVNTPEAYLKVARYEEKNLNLKSAREIYENGLKKFKVNENYIKSFINFEIKNKEYERVRILYKYAMDIFSSNNNIDDIENNDNNDSYNEFFNEYLKFEKKYGNINDIENIIINKRRNYYEAEIEKNPSNYDIWFDYIKLEENFGDKNSIRNLYERITNNHPIINEKKYWKRYIYFFINYAIFEEIFCENLENCENIYKKLIYEILPSKQFFFSKIFIQYANFALRQKDLKKFRKIMGYSMGKYLKEKIINYYIDIEINLGNLDRVRQIYESAIQKEIRNGKFWKNYAEFEINYEEDERAIGILELACNVEGLNEINEIVELLKELYLKKNEFKKLDELKERFKDNNVDIMGIEENNKNENENNNENNNEINNENNNENKEEIIENKKINNENNNFENLINNAINWNNNNNN